MGPISRRPPPAVMYKWAAGRACQLAGGELQVGSWGWDKNRVESEGGSRLFVYVEQSALRSLPARAEAEEVSIGLNLSLARPLGGGRHRRRRRREGCVTRTSGSSGCLKNEWLKP